MNCDIDKNRRMRETFLKFCNMDTPDGTYILDCYNRNIYKDIHPTLTTRQSASNCNFFVEKNNNIDMKVYRLRKMTPRECGRLMGIDDQDIDIMLDCGLKDSALYKMYGNSIVVHCLEHIFGNLFLKEQKNNDISLW